MIASGVLYTSFQNLAIAIPMERDDGTLKRIQGTPMPKVSYFIGKIGLVYLGITVIAGRFARDPDHFAVRSPERIVETALAAALAEDAR